MGTYFENGASITVIYNDHFEQLDEPFPIRADVTIPVGTYRFGEWSVSYRSDPSRRFYQQLRYSPQTFFDGTRTDWSATLGLRATARIAPIRSGLVSPDDAADVVAIQLHDRFGKHERAVQLDLQPRQRSVHCL